ncbi:hypothetical protein KM043_013256 [Ampulex compressa]|nr:hypothetical protein KM043_013256 [Ampulex compressa]
MRSGKGGGAMGSREDQRANLIRRRSGIRSQQWYRRPSPWRALTEPFSSPKLSSSPRRSRPTTEAGHSLQVHPVAQTGPRFTGTIRRLSLHRLSIRP